jgi:nucleoside-diphosphate-sugar epimerase
MHTNAKVFVAGCLVRLDRLHGDVRDYVCTLSGEAIVDVLVTGAGGRIGSRLTRLLLAEGHTVRAFGLAGDPGLDRAGEAGARVCPGDLEVPGDLVAAAAGVDAVCHLAAALTTHDVTDDRFVDVNLRGTFNLLEAVRRHAPGVKRFVYVSSDAVYLSLDAGGEPGVIDETHPQRPGTVYGATKVGAELLCRSYWKTYGIPYAVMRPTATAEPGEFIRPSSVFGRRWFAAAAISWYESRAVLSPEDLAVLTALREVEDPDAALFLLTGPDGLAGTVTYGDARDAAAGLRAMIDAGAAVGEAFNIGPAAPCSERDFAEHLGRRLGLRVIEIALPLPRRQWRVSSDKARRVLGYDPVRDPLGMIDEAVAQLPVTERRPT